MKLFKTLKVYKNSTGTNVFNYDTMVATSYGWWEYFKIINGKKVFNFYSYSPSTYRHQRDLLVQLRKMGIEIDYFIDAPKGLQDLRKAYLYYNSKIKDLIHLIKRPRSQKRTNERRLALIEKYLEKRAIIRMLID